jgi:WD40 repeat protein
MHPKKTYYHKMLAEYFMSKLLWFDEKNKEKPNIRKLVEQPWQQTKGKIFNDVTDTLCDLRFIQAKCQVGMTYGLVRDYDHAITAFMMDSGSVANIQDEWRTLESYSHALMEYARSNVWVRGIRHDTHKKLLALKSVIEVADELENKDDKNSGISRLKEFGQFVRVSSPLLNEFCQFPGFLVQHIYNSMNRGVITKLAEEVISNPGFQSPVLIRAGVSRHNYEEKPSLILKLNANAEISSLTITADGTKIITGDGIGTIRIWNARTGECEKTVHLTSQYYHVQGLAISADGRIAVTAPDSSDKVLRIWNLISGSQSDVSPLSGHEKGINTISITPDGSLLASGGNDGTVRLWDVDKGTCLRILNAGNTVNSVQISPDARLVTALAKNEIISWNAESGEMVNRTTLGSSFSKFVMSLNGEITMLSELNRIAIWSVDNKAVQQLCELPKDVYVNSMAITPDGAFAVCGSSDHTVRIFDVHKRTEVRNYRGHSQRVLAVALRADGKYAVSSGSDGTVCLWDTASSSTPPIPSELQGKVRSLGIVCDQKVALCQRDDGTIRFYKLDSGEDITLSTENMRWAIDADGRYCFTRSAEGIQCWDMKTGHKYNFIADDFPKSSDISHPLMSLMTLQTAISGHRAITAGKDKLWVWDLGTGRSYTELALPGEVMAMAISADGRFAAAAGWKNMKGADCGIRLWELSEGKLLHTFPQDERVNSLLFTPDCRALIGGSSEGILYIWNINNGQLVRKIGEKKSFLHKTKSLDISGLKLLQHGRKAIVAGNNSFTACDLRNGKIENALATGIRSSDPLKITITEDGQYAFTGIGGQNTRIWDIEANLCIAVNAEKAEIVKLGSLDHHIAIINIDGEALFATISNLKEGPAIITALPNSSQPCPFCNAEIKPLDTIWEKISQFENRHAIVSCPSLELPVEAWDDEVLLTVCNKCNKPLRYNPFFASGIINSK